MTSALTNRGSTRRWRLIRASVLGRDEFTCQVPAGEDVCGARATDAGHIVARVLGGTDEPDNLRAECAHHNRRAGALLRNGRNVDPFTAFRGKGW